MKRIQQMTLEHWALGIFIILGICGFAFGNDFVGTVCFGLFLGVILMMWTRGQSITPPPTSPVNPMIPSDMKTGEIYYAEFLALNVYPHTQRYAIFRFQNIEGVMINYSAGIIGNVNRKYTYPLTLLLFERYLDLHSIDNLRVATKDEIKQLEKQERGHIPQSIETLERMGVIQKVAG